MGRNGRLYIYQYVMCMNFRTPQSEKQSHVLDLLDVNLGEASGSSVQTDPWGIPVTPPRPQVPVHYSSQS